MNEQNSTPGSFNNVINVNTNPPSNNAPSNVPMILGIIGFVVGIPGLICITACVAAVSSLGGGVLVFPLVVFKIIPLIAGFIFCFMTKSMAKPAGIVLIISAILLVVGSAMLHDWLFGLISVICYLIAGVLALQQK
jgi:hypothetical protein